MPMGTSIRPPRRILPARAKTLVPLLFSVPKAAKARGAVAEDPGNEGERFDVVDQRGLVPEPHSAGYGGRRRGMPRRPFDGGQQRGLLAADEGPRAFLHFQRAGGTRCRRT